MKILRLPCLILSLSLLLQFSTTAQSVHQGVKMTTKSNPSKQKSKKASPDAQEREEAEAAEAALKAQADAQKVAEIQTTLTKQGKYTAYDIHFKPGTDVIDADSCEALNFVAKVLIDNPKMKLKVIGYPDTNGTDATKTALAKRRAEAIKYCFKIDFKIDEARITTDGKAKLEAPDPKKLPGGKAVSRRVDFLKL